MGKKARDYILPKYDLENVVIYNPISNCAYDHELNIQKEDMHGQRTYLQLKFGIAA